MSPVLSFLLMEVFLPLAECSDLQFSIDYFQLRKKDSSILWCATLWFMFPLAFAVYGAIFSSNEFNVRYTILSFLPFLLFLITGIQSIKFKWIRLSTLGVIVLVSAFSLSNHYFNHQYHKEDNRAAGQFLTTHAIPNDLVIFRLVFP